MPWELDNDRPIYLQLMERIQQDIVSGIYKPVTDSSPWDLAVEAAVNPNTMQSTLRTGTERTGIFSAEQADVLLQKIPSC